MTETTDPLPFAEGSFDLTGRTIVVTGGGSGIGATLAEALLAAGARVSVWGRDPARLDAFARQPRTTSADALLAVEADVTDEASVTAALRRIVDAWGAVDGLVNCAGGMKVGDSIGFPPDDFRSIVEVNLTGTFLCSQQVAGVMRDGHGGSIVNIGSLVTFI